MNILPIRPYKHVPSFRRISFQASSYRKKTYTGIGDKTIALMNLSDREFIKEINNTRQRFAKKFPHLTDLIFEYRKQCTLLDLDFWYEKPVPERCEKFVRMDIMTLMNNIDVDTEEGQQIASLCDELLRTYIANYENRIWKDIE